MFSVVIPLYNKEKNIRETILSVINQTFQDFEIIVVNDGSKDRSVEVVKSIKDDRIKIIHQENSGVSVARNRGIQEANRKYIALLDADDIWFTNHLETIYNLAIKFPEISVFSTAYELKHGKLIQKLKFMNLPNQNFEGIIPDYFKTLATGANPTWTSVVVIEKKVFEEVGGFPIGVRMGEDIDTWIRIGIKHKICFSTIITAQYNLEADNRACNKYNETDLDSVILTKWFDYLKNNDSKYLKLFIKKTQLNFIYNLTVSGLGRNLRKRVLFKIMFNEYSFFEIFPYYLLSFLSDNLIHKIKYIKRKIKC